MSPQTPSPPVQTPRNFLNTLFRQTIQPAYLYKWVCHWAFRNITTSPFHDDPILPIQSFSQLTLLTIDTRFQNPITLTETHNQCEGHATCIPSFQKENITLGYTLCFSSDISRNVFKDRLPSAPPYAARFVMDHATHQFVMYVPCTKQNIITIHSFHITRSIQYTFLIPLKEYDWDSLPNYPPVVLEGWASSPNISNLRSSISSFYANQENIYQVNENDLTFQDIEHLMTAISVTPKPQTSSSFTSQPNLQYQVDTIIPNLTTSPRSTPLIPFTDLTTISDLPLTNTSPLSPQQDDLFRSDLISIFHERICCIGTRLDTDPYIIPGYQAMMSLTNIHHMLYLSGKVISRAAGPRCAFVYYSHALGVSADAPLFKRPELAQLHIDLEELKHKGADCQRHQNKLQKMRDRELILHERRKRNRLSAARSNARKQERVEKMEKELESTKAFVKQLKVQEQQLIQKNKQLKSFVQLSQRHIQQEALIYDTLEYMQFLLS